MSSEKKTKHTPGKATQLKDPIAIAPRASALVGANASRMSCVVAIEKEYKV